MPQTTELVAFFLTNLSVFIVAAWKLSNSVSSIDSKLTGMSDRVEKLELKLETSQSDRVKIERLEQDVQELRRELFRTPHIKP